MDAVAIVLSFMRSVPLMVVTTGRFLLLFAYFLALGGSYRDCSMLSDNVHARVHVYSLALMFRIWNWPHYRNGTFGQDMRKNLRNVAIPGTGIPLSLFCYFRVTALLFVVLIYPFLCVIAAGVRLVKEGGGSASDYFREQLLTPQDWFSFWTMNCRLASYHAHVTQATDYDLENKWEFLQAADAAGVPVSPWLSECAEIVVKDKNEEGGMGIHFFTSASHGGQWVIQKRLHNGDEVQRLLPANAPLSTIRVITGSTIASSPAALQRNNPQAPRTAGAPSPGDGGDGGDGDHDIIVFSSVFRAGRAGANTDHSSILFDIDSESGRLRSGTTNAHWYVLGPHAPFTAALYSFHNLDEHPDTGVRLNGERLTDMEAVHALVQRAHKRLIPRVTMAGWDVALTPSGPLLLEVNLSCNFFRGSFELDAYIAYVHKCFVMLEEAEQRSSRTSPTKKVQ